MRKTLFVLISAAISLTMLNTNVAQAKLNHIALDSRQNTSLICQDEFGYLIVLPDGSRAVRNKNYNLEQIKMQFGYAQVSSIYEAGSCDWPGGPRCQDNYCSDYDAAANRRMIVRGNE